MGDRNPKVDAYIAKAKPFAQPILKHIRKAVHAGCPDVEETIKWSTPHFTWHGMLCAMAAFKEHVRFGFWKGELLGLGGDASGMTQFGRITSIDDLPPEKKLVALVKKAAKLNAKGVKSPRLARPASRRTVDVPEYVLEALRTDNKARQVFDGFSPSHRREYIEWITEARTDQTRQRRLETAVKWMAEGKGRNWKYESEVRD
jgi:uncharacterized protein YdeI (YjbR/CyaY-like superfamily)